MGSYTLSKTGEGLNVLLKNARDIWSSPLVDTTTQLRDPTIDQMNDPTIEQ